jgi:GntR family transcriptional regulator, vanillate catabolism transcriptional regulator
LYTFWQEVPLTTHEQKVLAIVRRKVLNGAYTTEDRISEVAIAEEMGVSRTPARAALIALEAEGLLEKRTGRGYSARPIRTEDVAKAIEIRGVLEGLAARKLAENGMSAKTEDLLQGSIRQSAALLETTEPDADLIGGYQQANVVFHETLMRDCGNDLIGHTFGRIRHLPLTALGTLAFDPANLERERMRLTVGHSQHVIILDAIRKGDGNRAEVMMREHSHATLNYSDLFARQ